MKKEGKQLAIANANLFPVTGKKILFYFYEKRRKITGYNKC